MPFPTRRGRPRKDPTLAQKDLGTPELQRKRQLSETTEAIDLLLQRGQISMPQHWCALHFRWLYTLRYGAPTVQSLDPLRVQGFHAPRTITEWQEDREKEWKDALEMLRRYRCLQVVLDSAVYNEPPLARFILLREGLELLERNWCVENTIC